MSYQNYGEYESEQQNEQTREDDQFVAQTQAISLSRGVVAPSKVLHIRNVAPGTRSEDLLSVVAAFGHISYVVIMPKLNQALVELDSIEKATVIIEYATSNPIFVGGRQVFVNYSKSKEINRGTAFSEQPNTHVGDSSLRQNAHEGEHTLLITIFNPIYTITTDVLFQIFSPHGRVLRVVLFEKNGVQALVELDSPENAYRAKTALNGKDIYDGCCTLKIVFSKIDRLNVKYNNDRTRDYTNHVLPSSPPSGGSTAQPAQVGATPPAEYSRFSVPATQQTGSGFGYPAPPIGVFGYGDQADREQKCVLMVYELDEHRITPQILFNLFCLYGNVMKVKLLWDRGKNDTAMVQMQDHAQASLALHFLNDSILFDRAIQLNFSRHPYIANTQRQDKMNENYTVDYQHSRLNRFTRGRDPSAYRHIYKPTKVLHFSNLRMENPTLDVIAALFTETGAPAPTSMRLFDNTIREDRVRGRGRDLTNVIAGLLEFETVPAATEALVLLNNTEQEENRIMRLAFSQNSVAEQEMPLLKEGMEKTADPDTFNGLPPQKEEATGDEGN